MSTTVSRGIDRRADAPAPVRISRIESDRLGAPIVLAPGSAWPFTRASDPNTRIVLLLVSGNPPARKRSTSPEILPDSICALIRNSTSDRPIHVASATTINLTTRPRVHGRRVPGALAPSPPRRKRSSAPVSAPRRNSCGGARYFLYCGGPSGGSGGRGPVAIAKEGRVLPMPSDCVIGVDLGGTKLLAGVVDRDLVVHHRAFRPAPREGALEALEEVVKELVQVADQPVAAVGLGIPSLIDRDRGAAMWTNHLELCDVPVRDLMAERLALPVTVD